MVHKTIKFLSRGNIFELTAFALKSKSGHRQFASNIAAKMESTPKLLADSTAIVWMDLEMTGLNSITDKIIEVACLITDKDLNILTEGLNFAINYPKETFEQMNEWCTKQHNESGLIQKCLKSDITPDHAESLILDYLQKHVPKGKCPLAGSSIYMDRLFLRQQMPTVDEYLHYRIIDVSSVKELCRRWRLDVLHSAPKKLLLHRSLDDLKESIEELKYYRENFFKTT
ncbi:probable oligoribonuclease [Rhagoletis pomonella]|uniref:probable oligoribonuclease n=1 Tax=Rhagoletis pomonella TaxID=28610 RepID=UPI001786C47A|nr:probable oligoribonuclease [Rhagoletis pomonella]